MGIESILITIAVFVFTFGLVTFVRSINKEEKNGLFDRIIAVLFRKNRISGHTLIRQLSKQFSLETSVLNKKHMLRSEGTINGQQAVIEFDESKNEVTFLIHMQNTGFQPFVLGNTYRPGRSSVLTGDPEFDRRLIVRGSDDLFAVLLSHSLRHAIVSLVEDKRALNIENQIIMLVCDRESFIAKPMEYWEQHVISMTRIAEELNKSPRKPGNIIASVFENQSIDEKTRFRCLQWLVKNTADLEKKNGYISDALDSDDFETIDTTLGEIKDMGREYFPDFDKLVGKFLLFPHIRIWSRASSLLGEKSVEIIVSMLAEDRTAILRKKDRYRHIFTVLKKIDPDRYWQELEREFGLKRLPDDIRLFLVSEIYAGKKIRFIPILKEFIQNNHIQAAIEAVKMIGECGSPGDIAFLTAEMEHSNSQFRNILKNAVQSIQHRYNMTDDGWLSVTGHDEQDGALSLTDTKKGSLSMSSNENMPEKS